LLIPNLVAITDAGPIRVAVAIYEPGNEFGVPLCWSSLMGDIDAESRKEKHLLMENLNYAPSLIPELKVNLESDEKFVSLLKLISPKNNGANVETFFKTFTDIHGILSHMFPSCS
jgi:hypothetical protein